MNAYATDYLLKFNGGTNTQITKLSIGGMIQKYFFVGTKPDAVITRFEQLVGNPILPPLWAFGWQCTFHKINNTNKDILPLITLSYRMPIWMENRPGLDHSSRLVRGE